MYQYILVIFLHKAYSKVDFGHVKILDTIFLDQSLLLSIVLNDNNHNYVVLMTHNYIHSYIAMYVYYTKCRIFVE